MRFLFLIGATDPIRTGDLLITSELLYLLSHSSILLLQQTKYSKFPALRQEKNPACEKKF